MKLFVSYRHVQPDIAYCERLMVHLRTVAEDISSWADTGIEPGDDWREKIETAIETADVGVLLVSADFLGSSFIKDVEIPMLVEARRDRGLRLIPLFAGPTGALPPGIDGRQGANKPGTPLSAMTRAKRETVFADFVKWLREHATAERVDGRADVTELADSDISLESAPSAGILFDRAEIQRDIREFFAQPNRRLCIVHGLHGVGKTSLAAKLVEEYREQFTDVFWVTGQSSERSGLMLLARLNGLLRRNGDTSLQGFARHLADPEVDIDAAISRAVAALTRVPYLLVFDDLQAYLNPANELVDDVTRRLLSALSRAAGRTKVLLVSNRRPTLEQGLDLFPTGAALERELIGLPADSVGELLAECGLAVDDAETQGKIATHFSGNPAMIKVYCSYVVRQRRDPIEALSAATAQAPFAALIGATVDDLEERSRDTLERLAPLRAALDWDRLEPFGLTNDDVVPLLDSWLVNLDPTSQTLAMPAVIRQFVLDNTEPERLRAAHLRLAEGYEKIGRPASPRSYDDVRPILEGGHHRIEAGEAETGAMAILDAVELLIQWGYGDLAGQEIGVVEGHTSALGVVARCRLQNGRIQDRQGLLDEAEASYRESARLAREVGDDQALAGALYRIGKIRNARSDFATADRELSECIRVCVAAGLERPLAAARLALAWGHKELGAPVDDVVAEFQAALDMAERHDDHATASDAHRQLGFISWFPLRDRAAAERHYLAAEQIATRHSLAKEIGAIHKELAYLSGEWGDLAAAKRHALKAVEAAEGLRDSYLLPGTSTNEAHILIRRGDLDGAAVLFKRSVREFTDSGNVGGEAYALHELGALMARQGKRDEALEALERARKLSADHDLVLQSRAIEATIKSIDGAGGA